MSVNLLIFSSSDIQQRKEQPAKLAETLALMLEYAVHDLISLTKRSLTIAQESKSGALILLDFRFWFCVPDLLQIRMFTCVINVPCDSDTKTNS